MGQFFKDITTCKDGESYDVVRVAIVIVLFVLPIVLVWGIVLFTYGYFFSRPFDMNSFFNGIGVFLMMFGAFLLQGAGALLTKKSTEPNEDHPPEEKKPNG
jgi:hypothetical protein